jgi:AraC family transcriptional regulator
MLKFITMDGRVFTLYQSASVLIWDYQCCAVPCSTSAIETADNFEITSTRTGHFEDLARGKSQTIDNSLLWLNNPGAEHRIRHDSNVRDTCTIFRFPTALLHAGQELFRTKNPATKPVGDLIFTTPVLPVTARMDYLHFKILQEIKTSQKVHSSLHVDTLAIRFLEEIFRSDYLEHHAERAREHRIDYREKIERAKSYILQNFDRDISLKEIARNTFISEFHFSRIFHSITNRSPHQYLLDVRFQHAIMLLRNTSQTITDICYSSGFQNYPHFIAAFTRRFGISPFQFKKQDFVRIS